MNRLLTGRLVLVAVGIVVWGYGHRADLARTRLAGIAILAVSLLLRFIPSRWIDGSPR